MKGRSVRKCGQRCDRELGLRGLGQNRSNRGRSWVWKRCGGRGCSAWRHTYHGQGCGQRYRCDGNAYKNRNKKYNQEKRSQFLVG